MTTSGQSAEGRRYAGIVGKSVCDLTPDDFAVLRRTDPALAEKRSREYDQWWASQHAPRTAAPATGAAAPRSLADQLRRELPAIREDETLDAWITKHRRAPTPMYVVEVLLKAIRQISDARKAETKALEVRIVELEARPAGPVYKGVWNIATAYTRGDAVTDHGSLWIAKTDSTSRRPGSESSGTFWQLAVRKGSDGKSCPACKADNQ